MCALVFPVNAVGRGQSWTTVECARRVQCLVVCVECAWLQLLRTEADNSVRICALAGVRLAEGPPYIPDWCLVRGSCAFRCVDAGCRCVFTHTTLLGLNIGVLWRWKPQV